MWRFLPADADLSLALEGHYQYGLVILSILLVILAAIAALGVVERASAAETRKGQYFWIALGALCLGFGIWSMHFIGMIGFRLPVPVQYGPVLTALSFFPALIASIFALGFFVYRDNHLPSLLAAGGLIGLGIGAMHYSGMEAMHALGVTMWYEPQRFVISLVVAVLLAVSALLVKSKLIAQLGWSPLNENLLVGTVLGLAASAMHYVAMSATRFLPGAGQVMPGQPINNTFLSIGIAFALVLLVLVVVASITIGRRIRYLDHRSGLMWMPLGILVIAGALAGTSSIFIQNIEKRAENNVRSALEAALTTTTQALLGWQNQHVAAVRVLAENAVVRQSAIELLSDETDAAELKAASAQAELSDWFSAIERSTSYAGYFLVDLNLRSIASDQVETIGKTNVLGSQPEFFERLNRDGALSLPVESSVPLPNAQGMLEEAYPTMFVGAPVNDAQGNPVAALLLRIDPLGDFADILLGGSVGQTGESYALDRTGLMLSPSRFENQLRDAGLLEADERSMLNIRITNPGANLVSGQFSLVAPEDRPLTLMAEEVTQGNSGISVEAYLDYRGIPVVGAWRWVEELGLGITTEEDFVEAMGAYLASRNAIVALAALAIGALFLFGILLALSRIREIDSSIRTNIILDTMHAAVLTWGDKGNIESSNLSGLISFRPTEGTLRGTPLTALLPGLENRSYAELCIFFDVPPGQPLQCESFITQARRLDGELFPTEVSVNETVLPSGAKLFTGIFRDITVRQKTETELLQANTEKLKYENELGVARNIQQNMLPKIFPPFPERNDVDIYATLKPASEVGGDFYNFFELPDGKILFTIGDVSGKGVPAALFMTLTKTLTESHGHHTASPGQLLTMVNEDLCKGNDASMFVTLFIAVIDPKSGEVCYSNGGHNPPYVLTDNGDLKRLDARHGPVIGAVEGLVYGEDETRLSQGDTLFMYTDGVTEAMDPEQELFGEDRLKDALRSLRYESATHIVKTLAGQVDCFEDNTEHQSDDITIMAVRLVHDDEDARVMVLELTLENRIEEINRVNRSFNEIAQSRDTDPAITQKFNIVFDELLSNIFYYGNTDGEHAHIRIRIEFLVNRIKVAISSYGVPFNPLEATAPNTTAELTDRDTGGLGIHIVRSMMDEVAYYRRADQNVINLLKFVDKNAV